MESSNPKHIRKRVQLREFDTRKLSKAVKRLEKTFKRPEIKRKLGNKVEWYYPVKDGKETHCYIVGRGVVMCSVITADMIPYGINIGAGI